MGALGRERVLMSILLAELGPVQVVLPISSEGLDHRGLQPVFLTELGNGCSRANVLGIGVRHLVQLHAVDARRGGGREGEGNEGK